MTLSPTTAGFKVSKMPRRAQTPRPSKERGQLLDELLRLHSRGQDEGLFFLESEHKRSSVRSAVETELVHRRIGDKFGVECLADPAPGGFWISLTTAHTVPPSRKQTLGRQRQQDIAERTQLSSEPSACEITPVIERLIGVIERLVLEMRGEGR